MRHLIMELTVQCLQVDDIILPPFYIVVVVAATIGMDCGCSVNSKRKQIVCTNRDGSLQTTSETRVPYLIPISLFCNWCITGCY